MLRKKLFSQAQRPKIFIKSTRLNDAVPSDGIICLYDGSTFVEPNAQISIKEDHYAAPVGESRYAAPVGESRWEFDTRITVNDDKAQESATFSDNTCWKKTRMSLTTVEGTVTKELVGATAEEKCEEIYRFFGKGRLDSNIFCGTSKGRSIDNILEEDECQIITKNGM